MLGRPAITVVNWVTLLLTVGNCKKKKEEEDNSPEPAEAAFVESDSDGDVFFATSTERGNNYDWILDSGCAYHMCPHKDWFSTYDPVD